MSILENKHTQVTRQNLNEVLLALIDQGGFNDFYLKTGYRPFMRKDGQVSVLFESALSSDATLGLAQILSGNDQVGGDIAAGMQRDPAYEIYDPNKRGVQYRFRVNIKGIRAIGGGRGIGITIRAIKPQAPNVKQLGVEQEILDNFFPRNGMVLVSGPVGSGKSTLFASCLQYLVETGKNMVIGTCEAPIEFVYDHVDMQNVFIYQSEIADIAGHIQTFSDGVRASLRSGTDGTVIGELRDLDTIRAALTASNTGQAVWGTLHVNSVVDIPSRIINVFPSTEINKVKVEFFANARFLLCQILVPCIKEGQARVAVKEWLKLTKDMRDQLILAAVEDVPDLMNKFLKEHGMPMGRYAANLLKDGMIDEETYQYVLQGE